MTEIDDENIFNFNYKKHKSSIDDDDLQVVTLCGCTRQSLLRSSKSAESIP